MKQELTFDAIDTFWETDENGNSVKYIAVSERYFDVGVECILGAFCKFIDHHKTKQTIEINKSGGSDYDKKHYVTIYDKDDNPHQGIICLSNHPMDIDDRIHRNDNVDFAISVVVYEGEKQSTPVQTDDIMCDNIITIYEYVIGVDGDSTSMLDSIVHQIVTGPFGI